MNGEQRSGGGGKKTVAAGMLKINNNSIVINNIILLLYYINIILSCVILLIYFIDTVIVKKKVPRVIGKNRRSKAKSNVSSNKAIILNDFKYISMLSCILYFQYDVTIKNNTENHT